jgi:hypothetical protein
LAGFAFFSLSTYETIERLELKSVGTFQAGGMSRIWFSSAGDLVGVEPGESKVTVRVRANSGAGQLREQTIAFENIASDKESTAKVPITPIYAVAEDASKVAWISNTGVRVANLFSPAAKSGVERRFKRTIPVAGLAFTGLGGLAVLYTDGQLELWDLLKDNVSAATHLSLSDPGPLLANGAYVAAYSPTTSEVFVFDTGAGDKLSPLEYKKYGPDILTATLSPQANFATGTRERVEQNARFLNAPGPVRALAFYDRDRVLVAGDFPNIYMLRPDQGPQQIATAGPGTTLLATDGAQFAFGDGHKINLFSHKLVQIRSYTGLARPSVFIIFALLAFSLVGIYWIHAVKLLSLRKPKTAVELAQTAKKEEEGPIPNALIEACQNGDCVLYAGSGLGAQAGLPTWQVFAAEFARWAGDSAGGDAGSVIDRAAATLENRQPALHDYLRSRFRVTSEISQSHRLIKEIDFPAVITTSLDNLLDRTFPFSGGRVYTAGNCAELAQAARRRDFFLLKPFGDLDEPDTVRLGPAQCLQTMRNNPSLRDLLGDLLQSNTILFLGASVEGLERDLENLALAPQAGRRHFILVPDVGDAWKAPAERIRERYGIEALTYIPSTSHHPEVVEFLTNLITAVRAKSSTEEYFADDDLPARAKPRAVASR